MHWQLRLFKQRIDKWAANAFAFSSFVMCNPYWLSARSAWSLDHIRIWMSLDLMHSQIVTFNLHQLIVYSLSSRIDFLGGFISISTWNAYRFNFLLVSLISIQKIVHGNRVDFVFLLRFCFFSRIDPILWKYLRADTVSCTFSHGRAIHRTRATHKFSCIFFTLNSPVLSGFFLSSFWS